MAELLLDFVQDYASSSGKALGGTLSMIVLEKGPDHPLFKRAMDWYCSLSDHPIIRNPDSAKAILSTGRVKYTKLPTFCRDADLALLIQNGIVSCLDYLPLGPLSAVAVLGRPKTKTNSVILKLETLVESITAILQLEYIQKEHHVEIEGFSAAVYREVANIPGVVKMLEILKESHWSNRTRILYMVIVFSNLDEAKALYPKENFLWQLSQLTTKALILDSLSKASIKRVARELIESNNADYIHSFKGCENKWINRSLVRLFLQSRNFYGPDIPGLANMKEEYILAISKGVKTSENQVLLLLNTLDDIDLTKEAWESSRITFVENENIRLRKRLIFKMVEAGHLNVIIDKVPIEFIRDSLFCDLVSDELIDVYMTLSPTEVLINHEESLDHLIRYHRAALESIKVIIYGTMTVDMLDKLRLNSLLKQIDFNGSGWIDNIQVAQWVFSSIQEFSKTMIESITHKSKSYLSRDINKTSSHIASLNRNVETIKVILDSKILTDEEVLRALSW